MPIIDDIRVFRGLEQNLPTLLQGQPAVTLDTNKFFVGTPNGNIEFAQQSAVSVLQKTPQEYEWTTTAGQIVYVLPSGTTYDTSSKWLTFTVGGATIEDSLIKKDSPTQFTLLVDPSVIPAGVKAVARWVMPYIPAGDNIPSQVATNTTNIATNTANIATNTTNIASNTASLADIATVNNHTVTYVYNPDGSVQSTTEKDASNNVIKIVTYTYNSVGDVATSIAVVNGKTVTTTYNYDANANITSTSNVIS